MKKPVVIVLTCEHAVNTIPPAYQHYFTDHQELLNTHRGIDFGAGAIAASLHQFLHCELFTAKVSRLLIDHNRSLTEPDCFSEISRTLTITEKNQLAETYYLPFRQQVERSIQSHCDQGKQVWHFSIHSFTPMLHGVHRDADIGLLYDPKRLSEKKVAVRWQRLLKAHSPLWRTRLNYPYKGNSDGFTSTLRMNFPDSDYVGIEVESNQALTQEGPSLQRIIAAFQYTLLKLIPK